MQDMKVLHKLFQKLVGWRGGALPRPSQWAKSYRFSQAQEGRQNNPPDCFAVGNPSEGFPIPYLACRIYGEKLSLL